MNDSCTALPSKYNTHRLDFHDAALDCLDSLAIKLFDLGNMCSIQRGPEKVDI